MLKPNPFCLSRNKILKSFHAWNTGICRLPIWKKDAEKRRLFANKANKESSMSEDSEEENSMYICVDYEKDALQQLESFV